MYIKFSYFIKINLSNLNNYKVHSTFCITLLLRTIQKIHSIKKIEQRNV